MICAKLSDAPAYRGIHPMLDKALELLTPEFLATVETQTRKLEGDDLYVTRFDVITSRDEGRLFEYHWDYLDIFTLTAGEERVDVAAPEAVALCEQHDDYWGGTAEAEQHIVLRPGCFLVLFPGDAHRPGMAVDTPQGVSRIVFKIRFKEN